MVESVEDDDEDDALRKPKIGPVILDQLRTYNFKPQVLWQPPLDVPHTIDTSSTCISGGDGTRTMAPHRI